MVLKKSRGDLDIPIRSTLSFSPHSDIYIKKEKNMFSPNQNLKKGQKMKRKY
jgi:hypothetical protein